VMWAIGIGLLTFTFTQHRIYGDHDGACDALFGETMKIFSKSFSSRVAKMRQFAAFVERLKAKSVSAFGDSPPPFNLLASTRGLTNIPEQMKHSSHMR